MPNAWRARCWSRIESAHNRRVFTTSTIPDFTVWKGLMKSLECETSASPYSARNSGKPIHFYCQAPAAKSVEIAGDFNQWTPVAMRRRPDGWWYLQVELTHGHRQYRFLVDGRPTLDPHATGVGRSEANERVSIIAVS